MDNEEREISTEGGAYVEGPVHTGGGEFVGRDKIIYETHYHYVDRPSSDVPYLAPSLPPHHVPREAELAELRALLLGEEHQVAVTTLRGMGGVGKTTLAVALCHDKQVIDAFLDGILWATLGPQADILSAQASWGEALGHDLSSLSDAKARAARLRSLLHDKRCLLVLDDVWDTAHLPPLQVGGPECATLVTTRERKVAQKVGMAQDLDVLEPEQAITLLERWAGEISEDEKAVAGELASRLGYLPLALALAGAQAQDGETWDDLLAAFHDAQGADVTLLDLDDPEMRDESLALTFKLSLERLGDALPEHFAMLGVFAAGREAPFTIEAAAAVWEIKPIEAKKILGRLVRSALLNKEGENYSLHLLLGDYARSRLDEATRQAAEAHHNAYYLEVTQRYEEDWQAAEAALPQIRAAWSRLTEEDANSLYTWTNATIGLFYRRGYWNDEVAWLEMTLAAVRAAGQRQREAWCECYLGLTYFRLGRLDEELEHLQTSLAIYREVGDRDGEAWSLAFIADIYARNGDIDKALAGFQASLAIQREISDRKKEAYSLGWIGLIHGQRGELNKALEHQQAALATHREVGSKDGEALTLSHLAKTYRRMNELDKALECSRRSLSIYREMGKRTSEARLLRDIGLICSQQGKLSEALAQFEASLTILHDLEDKAGQAETLRNIGITYEQMGQLAEAERHLSEALVLFDMVETPQAEDVRKDLKRVRGQLGEE